MEGTTLIKLIRLCTTILFLLTLLINASEVRASWKSSQCMKAGKLVTLTKGQTCAGIGGDPILSNLSPSRASCSVYDFKGIVTGEHFGISKADLTTKNKEMICGRCADKSGKSCNYVYCGYKNSSGVNIFKSGNQPYQKFTCDYTYNFSCKDKFLNQPVFSKDKKSYSCNYNCDDRGRALKTETYDIKISSNGVLESTENIKKRVLCPTQSCSVSRGAVPAPLSYSSESCSEARLCKIDLICFRKSQKRNYKTFALCEKPSGVFCKDMTQKQIDDCTSNNKNIGSASKSEMSDESYVLSEIKRLTKERDETKKNSKKLSSQKSKISNVISTIKKCAQKNSSISAEDKERIESYEKPNDTLNKWLLVEFPISHIDDDVRAGLMDLELMSSSKLSSLKGKERKEFIERAKKALVDLKVKCPTPEVELEEFERFGKNNIDNPSSYNKDFTSISVVELVGKADAFVDIVKDKIVSLRGKRTKDGVQKYLDLRYGEGVFTLTRGTEPLLNTVNFVKLIENKGYAAANCKAVRDMVGVSKECDGYDLVVKDIEESQKIAKKDYDKGLAKADKKCRKDNRKVISDIEKGAKKAIKKYFKILSQMVKNGKQVCEQKVDSFEKPMKIIMDVALRDGSVDKKSSLLKVNVNGCNICKANAVKLIASNNEIDFSLGYNEIKEQAFSDEVRGQVICSQKSGKCPSLSACIKSGDFAKSSAASSTSTSTSQSSRAKSK